MENNNMRVYVISDDKKKRCEGIINAAAAACGGVGAGVAQIPLADSAIITPIQIAMVVGIGKEFDLDLTESAAMAIIASMSSALVGRCVSAGLFGWFPIIGNVVNAATAVGLTELIGRIAMKKFAEDYYTHETIDVEDTSESPHEAV